MQGHIHPTYYSNCKVHCACGASFEVGSTKESIETEIRAVKEDTGDIKKNVALLFEKFDEFAKQINSMPSAKAVPLPWIIAILSIVGLCASVALRCTL